MPPFQLDRLSHAEDRLRQEGFRQLEPFFVLREGEIKDERTGGIVKLTRGRLQQIAAIQNNRIAETGDFTPIIIGHTKKNKKEVDQPRLTGWASRYEVIPFMETGTWGLRAVPWSRPENVENFSNYPRRSAELWTNPDLIDPISLLGANTPRLDLGLHRLQRSENLEFYTPTHNRSGIPLYLEMDMADEPQTADRPASGNGNGGGGDNSVAAAVFNSPEWKQLQETVSKMAEVIMPLIEEMQGGGGQPPGAPPGGPPGGPPGVPPPAVPAAPAPEPAQAQMAGHPTVQSSRTTTPKYQHQFNMSPPGGTNTMMPTQMARGSSDDPRDAVISDLQERLFRMEQQNAAMQLSMIEQTVNTTLDDLQEKIVLDRSRDFARLVRLSRAEFDSEIQHMLATRKAVEPPEPPEAVPLHMQAGVNQVGRGPAGPMQLTMTQAHDLLSMGPDPAVAQPGPMSLYDSLMEQVRNRKRGESTQDVFDNVMGKINSQRNGTPSVRG